MRDTLRIRFDAPVLISLALLASAGCSLRSMAVNAIVPVLANQDVYLSEEDPELVRESLPFLLKTIESIIQSSPGHHEALVSACSGFTLYGNAFIQMDADLAEWDDYGRALELRGRAARYYVRARDYCLRSLELTYDGIGEGLRQDPVAALEVTDVEDVEVLYLLGAAWGLAISNTMAPALVADLPAVRALMARALVLDADYDRGAIHEALIILESLPAEVGGSPERAREHFDRAVELSGGLASAPYVSYAVGILQPAEERVAWKRMLEQALAIDPDEDTSLRLMNLVNQKRARTLLDHIDDLFF
ncbi:MAG: hypothetical protein E2P06_09480 [Acidobacteria bacterium]|nr:MAG: hypothetical protein E2P06_09480 [Acidobacteriota bacterium]